ncbi:hypothetical protein [Glutamicibacter arilaitensis]|uniref:hypothetical protein n=1 Tax=Glutamicibacter arilaitensis TaxID=256701 RepID=UPI0016749C31|nr:hypothetical protein [Glutamicibacter arilaitensis]
MNTMPDFPKKRLTLPKSLGVLLIIAIILASLNLRPAVTSLGLCWIWSSRICR